MAYACRFVGKPGNKASRDCGGGPRALHRGITMGEMGRKLDGYMEMGSSLIGYVASLVSLPCEGYPLKLISGVGLAYRPKASLLI